jgi:hypothetical protein
MQMALSDCPPFEYCYNSLKKLYNYLNSIIAVTLPGKKTPILIKAPTRLVADFWGIRFVITD